MPCTIDFLFNSQQDVTLNKIIPMNLQYFIISNKYHLLNITTNTHFKNLSSAYKYPLK